METNNCGTYAVTYNYDTVSSLNTTTWDSCTIKSNIATAAPSITISADEIKSYVRSQLENKSEPTKEEEDNKMNNKIFNFDFGSIKSDNVRMSMYGLAVKNRSGNYVAWDKENESIMNVDILNFNGDGLMYKIPVPIKDIKDGDIIIHNRVPMFVVEVYEKTLGVIDAYSGEKKNIIPAKSPFNFDFCTKIISILDTDLMADSSPSEDNPFGNLWMLMLLSGSMDNDSNLLPLMLMAKGDSIDPIMLMCLMNNKNTNNNILPLLMMSKKFGQS